MQLRIANEHYLRDHPEIKTLVSIFVRKVLDERPDNILSFAGAFFDRAELKEVVESKIDENRKEQERNAYLNSLSGKVTND